MKGNYTLRACHTHNEGMLYSEQILLNGEGKLYSARVCRTQVRAGHVGI